MIGNTVNATALEVTAAQGAVPETIHLKVYPLYEPGVATVNEAVVAPEKLASSTRVISLPLLATH